MTPGARLAAAAGIMDILDFQVSVDVQLKAWARRNRYAGSGDRRAIADRVYSVLRKKRSSAITGGGTDGRALILGNLVAEDGLSVDEIAGLCCGPYGLAPLSEQEKRHLGDQPLFVDDAEKFDWPEWLYPEALAAFGKAAGHELNALRSRAPVDLRVNLLAATREHAINMLAAEGITAHILDHSDTALRVAPSTPVSKTDAYNSGVVELQDAASQVVADFARVTSGDTVLDFCAGGGGKTLALAARMENRGYISAFDVNAERMADLPNRIGRAGITIIECVPAFGLRKNYYDAVLVDAPCSGSGSWRRDPSGKWRLNAEGLDGIFRAQRDALINASDCVKPEGTLTYATCSVLPVENRRQIDWFLSERTGFRLEETRTLWPYRDDCDGFYMARLRRSA